MTVVLFRHAERDPSGSDALSAKGTKRAAWLVQMFGESGVTAIFTSQFTRTKQTAAPLARALGLTAKEIASDLKTARAQIVAAGALPMVVGHSDSVPRLIEALGGPADIEIGETEFDHMFVVTIVSGTASTLAFRYVSA